MPGIRFRPSGGFCRPQSGPASGFHLPAFRNRRRLLRLRGLASISVVGLRQSGLELAPNRLPISSSAQLSATSTQPTDDIPAPLPPTQPPPLSAVQPHLTANFQPHQPANVQSSQQSTAQSPPPSTVQLQESTTAQPQRSLVDQPQSSFHHNNPT
nr:hypothetical protein Iba_chr14aCG7740 [Ipomoea batatas]